MTRSKLVNHAAKLSEGLRLQKRTQLTVGTFSKARFKSTDEKLAELFQSGPCEKTILHPGNSWLHPGTAQFDFRSDVCTTPTISMLKSIVQTTLLDDVFRADPTTIDLELHIASLASHPAALFVPSGTMANQVALRTHLKQPPHAVLCDHRSHIIEWEAGGVASLCGALVKGIIPSNGKFITQEDIQQKVVLGDDICSTPTRVISLENTLDGTIMPLEETRRITSFARRNGIKTHLDGARLWEVVAAGAGSLDEYCKLFDSVSLCFSKGLGAPVGSILVGDQLFIHHARWIRKSIGGGLRQSGVLTAAARVAVDETFGSGSQGKGGKLRRSHELAKKVSESWTKLGGSLLKDTETNMVWLDLERAGVDIGLFTQLGEEYGIKVSGPRLVIHYQINQEAIKRLETVFRKALCKAS
ncbi:BgTH12-01256 [Blumeria graminis f. sp. triticale]|nr:BgTH12-01256 [Blumeria graminis f. sp. triticale]